MAAEMATRDFKYYSLLVGESGWEASLRAIRSECLHPLANAFATNLMRTASLAFTPVEIAYRARQDQRFEDYAAFKSTGNIDLKLSFLVEEELSDVIRQEIKQERDKEKLLSKNEFGELRKDYGLSYIESFLNVTPGMQVSMEALMSSVVVESWMTFETLSADLWFTALDHGPAKWRIRTLRKANKFKKNDPEEKPSTIRTDELPDPSEALGSFLKGDDKVSFKKMRLIISWYKTTFGNEMKNLFNEHPYIVALSAVRNAIIHKAGIADKKYIDAVGTFPELNRVGESNPISLDGKIVRNLRNAAINLGTNLLLYIDDVITPPGVRSP
jgi:hypothetical protein